MKKLLSLLVFGALFTALTSCHDDDFDASKFYANNPSSYDAPKDKSYTCKLSVSNDMLDLFDVKVTRTSNFVSEIYQFSGETTITLGSHTTQGRTVTDQFTTPDNRKVYIKASLTPKSNWRYFIGLNPRAILYLGYTQEYGFGNPETNMTLVEVSKLTDDSVRDLGIKLAAELSKESE